MIHPDRHKVVDLINRSLSEDIGSGDITSRAILDPGKITTAELIAKENLVICGVWVFQKTFMELESSTKVKFIFNEGDYVEKGEKVAVLKGLAESILSAERTALNFIQRMSGIATLTKMYVDEVKHTKAVILDTRKTMPGLRILDKHAVVTGGGKNHRLGLFDMVIIKENHITAAGSVEKAVKKVRDRFDDKFILEVEVKNLAELNKVLPLKVDRILLDNMTIKDMQEAVRLAEGKTKLEASGNVSLENVKSIAETGVDYISVGSLTHSVKAADLSLLIQS